MPVAHYGPRTYGRARANFGNPETGSTRAASSARGSTPGRPSGRVDVFERDPTPHRGCRTVVLARGPSLIAMTSFVTRSHAHQLQHGSPERAVPCRCVVRGVRVLSDGRCVSCGRWPAVTVAETWHERQAA